jgi:hypothetical protein
MYGPVAAHPTSAPVPKVESVADVLSSLSGGRTAARFPS